ncbi:hypothetical protein FQA47_010700 [Oryzias melastigma]|uniref:Uncharacterized protein n=1 Tax=Oryzias melastigma TaxID=30732 RepID=A0A834BVA7_ORYME|nr:hypothetical protein FQA47_010700 [Oryzias melastigma]
MIIFYYFSSFYVNGTSKIHQVAQCEDKCLAQKYLNLLLEKKFLSDLDKLIQRGLKVSSPYSPWSRAQTDGSDRIQSPVNPEFLEWERDSEASVQKEWREWQCVGLQLPTARLHILVYSLENNRGIASGWTFFLLS